MDPVDALDEIAYLLERELASGFKTKAFRTAEEVLRSIPAGERAEQVRDGRLQKTKGIGGTTFTVIQQAVDGKVPDYLADLRERASEAPAEGRELRAKLRGDLHSH